MDNVDFQIKKVEAERQRETEKRQNKHSHSFTPLTLKYHRGDSGGQTDRQNKCTATIPKCMNLC